MSGVYIKGLEIPKVPTRFIVFSDGRIENEDDAAYKYTAIPVPDHGRLIDADKLIDRLEKQRTVILHQLPGVHSRTDGYTSEDYVFERNGDMISMLRNHAAIIPADKEGEA